MMKSKNAIYYHIITIFYLSLGMAFPLIAKNSDKTYAVTRCLGNEERFYHLQKISGPHYQLNQILINEFADLTGVTFRPEILNKLCIAPYDKKISRNLWDSLFRLNDHGIVEVDPRSDTAKKLKIDFISKLPALFDQYVLILGNTAPHAHCLLELIPELKEIQEERKYLGDKILFFDQARKNGVLNRALDKLQKIPKLWKNCPSKTVPTPTSNAKAATPKV